MSDRHLTEAHRKALNWLVPGSDCGDAPRAVSAALNSLVMYHPDLASSEWKETLRGRRYLAYKLTDLGLTSTR